MLGDMVATQSGAIVTAPCRRKRSLCGAVPVLRSTLDPERRRRLSCRAGRNGQNQRRAGPVRSWRASRSARWGSQGGERLGFSAVEMPRRNSMSSSARMENPSIRPRGGRSVFLEGQEMIRKLSLLFAGALMGASAMSLVYGAPGSTANAAGSETYKQLAIFGDIFERVRGAVCDAARREVAGRERHQRHADLARSAFLLHESGSRQGHARPDQGRVRRPRHRGHDGERAGQGDHADRRHARRPRPACAPATTSPRSTARKCAA